MRFPDRIRAFQMDAQTQTKGQAKLWNQFDDDDPYATVIDLSKTRQIANAS